MNIVAKTREISELYIKRDVSIRELAKELKMCKSTVGKYLQRCKKFFPDIWPEVTEVTQRHIDNGRILGGRNAHVLQEGQSYTVVHSTDKFRSGAVVVAVETDTYAYCVSEGTYDPSISISDYALAGVDMEPFAIREVRVLKK